MASPITPEDQRLPQHLEFCIARPPHPPIVRGKSVFLAGSIDQGASVDWQSTVASSLAHLPITILNPRRVEWDSTWVQDISNACFREQVEWELNWLESADVIAMFFAEETLAPISLMELGLHAASGKAVVCCPRGYWRRGNIQIVCARYGILLVEKLEELIEVVIRKLGDSETEEFKRPEAPIAPAASPVGLQMASPEQGDVTVQGL